MNDKPTTAERLEYLRGELRAERISYGELVELQSLIPHIDTNDLELLEAAGQPEPQKNADAVRLGRMGKGKTKVLSEAERQRRRLAMIALNAQRRGTIITENTK